VPGLGQARNRELAKGVSLFLSATCLLIIAADVDERLFLFLGVVWIYGVVDAFYTAAGHRQRQPTAVGTTWGWLLLATGALAGAHNLGVPILGPAIVPAVLILIGGRLLFTYFRNGEARS